MLAKVEWTWAFAVAQGEEVGFAVQNVQGHFRVEVGIECTSKERIHAQSLDGAGSIRHHFHGHNQAGSSPSKRVELVSLGLPVVAPISNKEFILLNS